MTYPQLVFQVLVNVLIVFMLVLSELFLHLLHFCLMPSYFILLLLVLFSLLSGSLLKLSNLLVVCLRQVAGVVDGCLVDLEQLEAIVRSLRLMPKRVNVHFIDEATQILKIIEVLFLPDLGDTDHGEGSN